MPTRNLLDILPLVCLDLVVLASSLRYRNGFSKLPWGTLMEKFYSVRRAHTGLPPNEQDDGRK